MSKADEMFEELGYKKEEHKNCIKYENEDYKAIWLWHISKDINNTEAINMQELKAINQKCKELGWLDEK